MHLNLYGLTDMVFSAPTDDELVDGTDFIVSSLPHRASAEVLAPLIERGARIVDLSGDFRLRDMATYEEWYGRAHPHPNLAEGVVYGCPELNAAKIASANLVASPGCFATSMNLALLPAAAAGTLVGRAQVAAMTGSSGSGATPNAATHHPVRSQTMRPYSVLKHRHTPEVQQLVGDAGSTLEGIDFTPVSAPVGRGILAVATCDLTQPLTQQEVDSMYAAYYADTPFVKVLTDREPEVAAISGTNYAEVRARVTASGRLHVLCALDNLVKGGAGQGLQCLNLMMGVDETTGLDWPGTWP